MRWFKHLVNSWDDEKIASVVSEHGLEMYGFWWRILEIIGKQMDASPKTFCQYSDKTWSKFTGVSANKFKKLAQKLKEKELIILKNVENEILIDIPNMVKFRDEWSKRKTKNS